MARLSLLTSVEAVEEALNEFRRLGRNRFLERYGFGESRDYFIRVGDEFFDSSPVISAAMRIEHPNVSALRPADLSSDGKRAARALETLGYEVTSLALMNPPRVGDEYRSRLDVRAALGGAYVQGIVRFPGEDTVNAFSDEEGPYADEPPAPIGDFGYRGEGLTGHHRLTSPGNALLEDARKDGSPVRFWFRPKGHDFRFWCWVVVVGRAWVIGKDSKKDLRKEIEWRLMAVPGTDHEQWSPEVELARSLGETVDDPSNEPAATSGATYADLCRRVGPPTPAAKAASNARWRFQRSATARQAVLQRSKGLCENPACTGMPSQLTRMGYPILEVDHIEDLGRGGDDHPSNMIALCPNCHAVKTRGRNAANLRRALRVVASRVHAIAIAQPEG